MRSLQVSPTNVGFGRGVNALLAGTHSDYVLTINQDAYLANDALAILGRSFVPRRRRLQPGSCGKVYEHRKTPQPSYSRKRSGLSGAACLFRRTALESIQGFERRIFMYGEDVDLSWRLRRRNWRILYLPRVICAHSSYEYAHQIKPV